MSGAALSIKLRCSSWQQLATIYKRDLSRGSMFLKSSSQPPIGTKVRIDLELPSSTVIELHGTIVKYSTDPQRGAGVDLQLEPLPTKSAWMIESALAAENKVRAQTGSEVTAPAQPATLSDGQEVSAAELELLKALEAEAESLKKLNPFLVLGVGYETTDADVRHAFGELTKRYHPDRFARYQSQQLRQIAAEIFILIRDAYRRLADDKGRQQAVSLLGPKVPPRAVSTPVRGIGIPPRPPIPSPPVPAPPSRVSVPATVPDIPPIIPNQHDAPTNPSAKSAQLAHTELARADHVVPAPPRPLTPPVPAPTVRMPTPPQGIPPHAKPRSTASPVAETVDT
ncbi:MAG: DnaJ domain-containing protein, partial [Kofleriaceae bacterium]|nr:DnaJ domain-containing protein [Kofleriaceae bacterium]